MTNVPALNGTGQAMFTCNAPAHRVQPAPSRCNANVVMAYGLYSYGLYRGMAYVVMACMVVYSQHLAVAMLMMLC